MNILHMKYAYEVARVGSINKASELLLIAQPNLSRSIKELEADLGITIFDRSAKGMMLTAQGAEFIEYAKKILSSIEELEHLYRSPDAVKQKFSVSVPPISYLTDAFTSFTRSIVCESAEIVFKETTLPETIKNVLDLDSKLGIIRYAEKYDRYFSEMFDEKSIAHERITEFRYRLCMSCDSPLAKYDTIRIKDLSSFVEVASIEPYVIAESYESCVDEDDAPRKKIYLYDSESQFELLAENDSAFMWVAPLPRNILDRYGLVLRDCVDNVQNYRDVLIRRLDYRLTQLDKIFISEIYKIKKDI